MSKYIMVTGGAGFIGSNFAAYLLEHYSDVRVLVLDKLTYAGNPANLDMARRIGGDRLLFVKGDICDTVLVESLIREYRILKVVNFAAESHVDRSIADADDFIKTNIEGTYSLLKACRKCWNDFGKTENTRFHQISTDEVYGSLSSPDDRHFTEGQVYLPNSPYASSKASADLLVRSFNRTYGLNTTVTHGSNTYGYCQHPEKLIPMTLTRALNGQEIPIYGSGNQVREWIFVTDHCKAVDYVLRYGKSGEHYNIDGIPMTNNEMVNGILSMLDSVLESDAGLRARFPDAAVCRGMRSADLIRHVTDRPGHDICYAVNAEKIERELGFKRDVELEAGLRMTFEWYLGNCLKSEI